MQATDNYRFGAILGHSFSLLRRHWKFFTVMAVLRMLPTVFTHTSSGVAHNLALIYPVIGLSALISCWIHGATVHFASQAFSGHQPSARESMVLALRRWPALIFTWLLGYLWILLGFMLLVIPGLLWGYRQMLAQVVVMLEDLSGPAALERSRVLIAADNKLFATVALGQLVLLMLASTLPHWLVASHLHGAASLAFQWGTGFLNSLLYAGYTGSLVVLYRALRDRVAAEEVDEGVGFTHYSG